MSFSDSKWIYFLAILGFCKLETEEMLSKAYTQKRCVANYFLDIDNICKGCPPGIFGLNCSQKCPSGTYGQFCSKSCQCPPDRCDRTHGCEANTKRTTQKTIVLECIADKVLENEEKSGMCVSTDGVLQCCLSFYLTNNTCKACPAGTYNNNCSDPCPPGHYGELCSKVCDCPEASCDKVHGCSQKACGVGFFGDNCNQTYPYGQYGKLCGKQCKCTTGEYCDKALGCVTKDSKTSRMGWTKTESTIEIAVKESTTIPTETKEQTNNNIIFILMGAVIAFLFLIILLTIVKKLCSVHSKRKYIKKENIMEFNKEGNEIEVYHEINMDEMLANQIELPDNRYNRIMDDVVRPKYLQIGSKIEKEIKQTYNEIDKENSTTTGNNGEYLEPESSGRVNAYIEVIEPLIHNSDSLNCDQDGGSSSNKSDRSYQDTGTLAQSDMSCPNDISDPKTHKSKNNEYLDVVNEL
ncbi:uncharacterized protein LOC134259009 [Saccostrea cucullata]|uniref:uncharacterized protein LOC134259009 n=1 Tax=Saccostrea cuccullata TaxID=36930 RepID=UPI002ED0DD1F